MTTAKKVPYTDYLIAIDYRSKWNDYCYDLISVRAMNEQQAIERALSKFVTRHGVGRDPKPRVELVRS